MQVSELLDSKGTSVVTVGADTTVTEVLAELARHNIGAVVISNDGRRIDGIASERDVVRALNEHGAAALDHPIRTIMSTDVYTALPTDSVDSLMTTMTTRRCRHVPVVDGGEIVGIVSIGDVVKSRTDELEHDRDLLVDYISAR